MAQPTAPVLDSTMQLHDPQGKRLYLTAEERRAFMAAASKASRPVRTFCAVLHDSGCRISEALALTPERIASFAAAARSGHLRLASFKLQCT